MGQPETLTEAPSANTRPFVVVTGGSEGIGFAIARQFARRNRNLLLVARNAERLETAASRLRDLGPGEVAILALDLVRPDAPALLDRRLGELGGHVHVLVNNAAAGHCGAFSEMETDELEALVALNIAAPLRLMRHVLPSMRSRKSGGILNVASLGGYLPGPWQAVYYASKAALVSASEAVATEVRRDGILVSVTVPGPVQTAFHARMGAEAALYRRLIPAASPDTVAAWSVIGYELGLRVTAPGILTLFGLVACRILPHALLVPLMAVLLHPRISTNPGAAGNA
jgi:uncharacterized protein